MIQICAEGVDYYFRQRCGIPKFTNWVENKQDATSYALFETAQLVLQQEKETMRQGYFEKTKIIPV